MNCWDCCVEVDLLKHILKLHKLPYTFKWWRTCLCRLRLRQNKLRGSSTSLEKIVALVDFFKLVCPGSLGSCKQKTPGVDVRLSSFLDKRTTSLEETNEGCCSFLSVGIIFFFDSPPRSRHLVQYDRFWLHSWYSIGSIRKEHTWRGCASCLLSREDDDFSRGKEWGMLFHLCV